MIRGLYTAALGMTVQMQKLDVVSNNIANVSTTGYKKDQVITRSFTDEMIYRMNQPTDIMGSKELGKMSKGVYVDTIFTNYTSGSFAKTDAPLDLAISGEGFFVVRETLPDGTQTERYTRNGSLKQNADGTLITSNGFVALGENGEIVLPQGEVKVDNRGAIFVNGEYIDTLRLVSFQDNQTLRKAGDSVYNTTAESQTLGFTGRIVQGFLENSNVNSVKEMIDMITATRVYEANQKVITIHDTILGRAVTDIPRKQ